VFDAFALIKSLLHLLSGERSDATPNDLLWGERTPKRNLATTYFTYTFPIHWTKNLQNLVRTTETR